MKSRQWSIWLILLLVAILTASCSESVQHLWLKSPGWSRAVRLGTTRVSAPVPIIASADGDVYFTLVNTDTDTETYTLDLVHYASKTGMIDLLPLNVSLQRPGRFDLLLEGGDLRLFWLDSNSLYTQQLRTDGSLVGEPVLLSEDHVVGSYALARSPQNELTLWYAGTRRTPGIYALSSVDKGGVSTLVNPDGILVNLQYDDTGTLHASWVYYPYGYDLTKIFYVSHAPGADPQSGESAVSLQSLRIEPTTNLSDFVMGLDKTTLYFFWTTSVQAGLQAGTITTQYIQFPLNQLAVNLHPLEVMVPTIPSSDFTEISGDFKVGPRISLQTPNFPGTLELQDITVDRTQMDELALAFRSPSQHLWRKVRNQVNIAFYKDGRPYAYQPISFTPAFSSIPNLVNDQDGYLYLTWLEGNETNSYSVYFTSTAPSIVAAMRSLTVAEISNMVLEVAFGMLIGMLLAPLVAAVWMIAPLFILLLLSPLGNIGSPKFRKGMTVFSLVLAITVVWFSKLAILPEMFNYVPFSAWIPEIPPTLGLILRLFVPLLTLAVPSFVAWNYTYRQDNNSSLYFVLIYIGVDALITTAIYAVLIYGTLS